MSPLLAIMTDNKRPEFDQVLQDIALYVHNTPIGLKLAKDTARLCFLDTLGCGVAALLFPQCQALLGPVVPGTVVPNGLRVPGTSHVHDPIRGAFAVGTAIRWLDYNDCWLAAEWGHPSDNLGGILAVADYQLRLFRATGGKEGRRFTVGEVLEYMVKAHEIQGVLALENSFNKVGLDHVLLVKVATAGVVLHMMGLTQLQTQDVLLQAFVDGQLLRTYRHAPNTMLRKLWAAGDACYRAVNLVYLVKAGELGMPLALTAKTWGFYDVLFKGKPFVLNQGFGLYVMENVLFKILYPAEFHAQLAVECALKVHQKLVASGKLYADIAKVVISTQDAGMRIIDKKGPLHNYADRDHCIQYMVAVPLIHGRLTANDYADDVAANPAIDALRDKMECQENTRFTEEYYAPDKRYIGNALEVTLNDGTVLSESIDYPVGHRKRREEGKPLLFAKFEANVKGWFDEAQAQRILDTSYGDIDLLAVDEYVDVWVK